MFTTRKIRSTIAFSFFIPDIYFDRKDYSELKVALPPKEEHVIMVRMSKIQEEIYKRFLLLMQENCGDQLNPIKIFAICSKVNNAKAFFLS